MSDFKSYSELNKIDFIEYLNRLDDYDSEKTDDFERLLKDLRDLRCSFYLDGLASVQEKESALYARVLKRFNRCTLDAVQIQLFVDIENHLVNSKDKIKCEDDYAEYIYIEYRSALIKLDEL